MLYIVYVLLIQKQRSNRMWKSEVPLSDTLRMIDLIKEVDIIKYSQVEYREVISSIMISFITDYEDQDVQESSICFSR